MSVVEYKTNKDLEVFQTFDSMSLRKELIRGVHAYGKNLNSLNYAPFSEDAPAILNAKINPAIPLLFNFSPMLFSFFLLTLDYFRRTVRITQQTPARIMQGNNPQRGHRHCVR